MINANYRWVIVAAGGLLGCVAIGAMFSLPVFLLPISRDTGWSVTGVSSAMTIGFLAMALASIAWGTLSDRLGPRLVVLDRVGHPVGKSGPGELGNIACRVSAPLRPFDRKCGRRSPRADDGLRDRLVRHPSQPGGVSRIRRHGNGADDHVALGGMARHHL